MEVIVDSDYGIDDATAVLAVLRSKNVSKVHALTVVDGNVPCMQGVKNARSLLGLTGQLTIPVFSGATLPIVPNIHAKVCWPYHGKDGFGDANANPDWNYFAATHFQLDKVPNASAEPAAVALVRIISANPGKITILALGPLTNLALAVSLDPTFLSKVAGVVVMGGCLNARGNSGLGAEFNFHCDPEAAHIVLNAASNLHKTRGNPSARPIITLTTWETTLDHGLDWTEFDELIDVGNKMGRSKYATLLSMYSANYERDFRKAGEASLLASASLHEKYLLDSAKFVMCDLYAAMAVLDPESIQSYKDWQVKVELSGTHTRGMMVMDWWGGDSSLVNCRVVFKLDGARVMNVLRETFL